MRVLYAVRSADSLSESYVRTEAEWVSRNGVEVAIIETHRHSAAEPLAESITVYRHGNLLRAAAEFKPDILHVHWLHALDYHFISWRELGLPVTVRGHSFDFLLKLYDVAELAAEPLVRRVWLLPPFAATISHEKVAALPACYDPAVYRYMAGSRPAGVLRAGAGLPDKGLEEFVEVARRCPSTPFTLAMTKYELTPDLAPLPDNCRVLTNQTRAQVVDLMVGASLYLRNCAPNRQDFAMPCSVAEAMATGLVPVLPSLPAARAYGGTAGLYYENTAQATEIINEAEYWPLNKWRAARERAADRAKQFSADVVLPQVLDFWASLL